MPPVANAPNKRIIMHRLFVYGTLKNGEPNHHYMSKENGMSRFISDAVTEEKFPLVIATKHNLPFLLFSPGIGYNVKGEVYEVDDKMLQVVDKYKRHPNVYERMVKNVIVSKKDLDTSGLLRCWVYFLRYFDKETSSLPFLVTYSSKGSHGKPYSCKKNGASNARTNT